MIQLDLIIQKMCDEDDYIRWTNQVSKKSRAKQSKMIEFLIIPSRLDLYFHTIKQIPYNQKKQILLAEDNSFIKNISYWMNLPDQEFYFIFKEIANSDLINYKPCNSSFLAFTKPKIDIPIQIMESLSIRPIINSTILRLVSRKLYLSTFDSRSIISDNVQKYFIFKENEPIAVITFYLIYNAFSIFAKNNDQLQKDEFDQIKDHLIKMNILDINSLLITNREDYFIAIEAKGSNIKKPNTELEHRFLAVYQSTLES